MNNDVKKFIGEIVNLAANPPGTGLSYGGLVGASSPRQHAMDDLKRNALDFAQESQKASPEKEKITKLSQEIEGNLLGLNSLQVIDDEHLDRLLTDLHTLAN